MKMTHPNAPAEIKIAGVVYFVVDGPVEIPNDFAALARSHGFIDAPEQDDDDAESVSANDEFHAMKRGALFAWLAEHGVSAKPPISGDELRSIARAKAAELASIAAAEADAEAARLQAEEDANLEQERVEAEARVAAEQQSGASDAVETKISESSEPAAV